MPTAAFVRESLPPLPARILEVGCGHGELARGLAAAGYDVTAIDPEAPEGPIFRRVRLEELAGDATYDAVVMVVSLHHVEDVGAALDRVAEVLRARGLLVIEEFAKERRLRARRSARRAGVEAHPRRCHRRDRVPIRGRAPVMVGHASHST